LSNLRISRPAPNHIYNAANRLTAVDAQSITYNNAGQMTEDGTLTYSWDRGGRLLSAGGSSYAYNGVGNRLSQTVSSIVTDYLLDLQPGLSKVLAATTSGNTTRYVHDSRGLHSQQQSNGEWVFPITDGLNSVRSVVDESFDILHSQHYVPYGETFGESGTSQTDFGFTGEPTDDNGLVHLRARYLNPALGVFPSLDPIEGDLQDVSALNRYVYVSGNVVNSMDPSGEISENPGQWDSCMNVEPPKSCPENSYTNASGKCCFRYNRHAARDYALNWATMYNPIFCNHDAHSCTESEDVSDCANFVSQALLEGNHPMAWPGGIDELDLSQRTLRDIYWAVACHGLGNNNCDGTKVWSVAPKFAENYLKNISPEIIELDPRASFVNDQVVREMIDLHAPMLRSSGIGFGDVLYLVDSRPQHVALVVGWGPVVLRTDTIPNNPHLEDYYTSGDLVPYVVDHGGQGLGARPYYVLRWNLGSYAAGDDWWFMAVPNEHCVEASDYIP
jgi:RHS repeat-associated protein